MTPRYLVLLAVLTLASCRPAWAVTWSLGSQMGLSTIRSSSTTSGSSTVLAWPSNAFTYQPGLRIGIGDSRHAREVVIDSGMFLIDEAGSILSLFAASASYQQTFMPRWRNAPFANAGIGFYREGGAARSATSTSFGAGVGVRHALGSGHGALRAEGRLDYLKDSDTFGRPALITLGLRLGFDLWL